jgi:ppGpp synthetase/RelA/SpoT-type nucleotidyltranferase
MAAGDELGYQSVHYLVQFSPERCALPEYQRFQGRIAEIQVRTVLQHGWAEIEHDIQYKAGLVEAVSRLLWRGPAIYHS